uniref:Putative conserved secreted protein n=1 Tax=Rhipicephalus microplus TaxID=6941 RepID=A0A6G5A756_RHIMP
MKFFYLVLALVVLMAVAQSGVMAQNEQLLMPWNQYRASPLLDALRGWIRRPSFTFTRPNFLPALSANAIRLRPGIQQVLRPMLQRPAIQSMIRPALNLRPVIATGIANLGSLIRRPFLNLEE